jgi:hypothetical protein
VAEVNNAASTRVCGLQIEPKAVGSEITAIGKLDASVNGARYWVTLLSLPSTTAVATKQLPDIPYPPLRSSPLSAGCEQNPICSAGVVRRQQLLARTGCIWLKTKNHLSSGLSAGLDTQLEELVPLESYNLV